MNAILPLPLGFETLGLPQSLLDALRVLKHEVPTPIQERTIPPLLQGNDVVGQAQTGTGKTAAFALPLLTRIEVETRAPQVLVLTPTRELAIQVADAWEGYAQGMGGVRILPIFGGQEYGVQIRGLKRGAQVVVGTPGRVMDHMRKGTLDLGALKAVVLDEADEMLHMGFVEDVEWVMERTPENRQVALFSATMPPRIRAIAKKYLKQPVEVSLESRSTAATTISQRYCLVPARHKEEALLRILEAERTDGVIIFMRTKADTLTLTETLMKAGYRAAALNGDLAQAQRERTVGRLRDGSLDILVATDVAARGLDVERVSHVINYDAPRDAESYVHRIGRTGRAGRAGKAILLLSLRDRQTLNNVQRTTRQHIEEMPLPSAEALNRSRVIRFADEIAENLQEPSTEVYRDVLTKILDANAGYSALDMAAALATMLRGDRPLLLEDLPMEKPFRREERTRTSARRPSGRHSPAKGPRIGDEHMERFRVQVGAAHGMNPSHLVGAIANEADLSSKFIGRIEIFSGHSTVDLPSGMPEETFRLLQRVRVCNRPLRIRKDDAPSGPPQRTARRRSSKGNQGAVMLKKSAHHH